MSQGFYFERDFFDLKKVKVVEENGEEVELVCNGVESVFEGEGIDVNLGFIDSFGDGVMFLFKLEFWKFIDIEGKKQYDREFLLDFQFMLVCI